MLSSFTIFKKPKQSNFERGFGLIELLVSLSIMTLVMTVMFTKQSSFNRAVLLRNEAYDVALAIRQAQLLAVSSSDDRTSLNQRYGIYFANNSQQYIIFNDTNNNGVYNSGTDTIISTGRVNGRFEIRTGGSNLSITFRRPNFDAVFFNNTTPVSSAYVDIAQVGSTGSNNLRRVEITGPGQIRVNPSGQ